LNTNKHGAQWALYLIINSSGKHTSPAPRIFPPGILRIRLICIKVQFIFICANFSHAPWIACQAAFHFTPFPTIPFRFIWLPPPTFHVNMLAERSSKSLIVIFEIPLRHKDKTNMGSWKLRHKKLLSYCRFICHITFYKNGFEMARFCLQ